MSNPDFVVEQPAEKKQSPQKSKGKSSRDKQLFELGKIIAAHFNIRALNAWETKASNKVYVLTGSHFLFFKLTDTKTVSLFKWSSIEKLDIPEKRNDLQFKFKPEKNLASAKGYVVRTDKTEFVLTFPSEKFSEIASRTVDILGRVLTRSELKNLSITTFNPQLTSKSALCRLKMGTQGIPSRFSQNTIQLMTKIIQTGVPHVDLSQFEDISTFITTFFDCVSFIRTLRSIEIPQLPNSDVYSLVSKLLKQRTTLKSISVQGKCNYEELNNMVDSIKNNRSLKLRGIEFGLTSFGATELNIISDLLCHSDINTLGLHDAFQSEKESAYFYNSILVPPLTQQLYCLNLNNTPNVDIEQLFPRLSKIRFLSLAYCGLEIIDVFSKLSLIADSRLKEIDLSGNRVSAEKYLDEYTKLPEFLSSLILNNLSWPPDTFKLFLYQIFKHIPNNLKLSLKSTIMDQNEWYKVFDSLGSPNENGGFNGLSVLVWDNNPLHKKFFSFLKQNKKLTRLQMNYCISSSNDQTEVFNKLIDYLAGARNLKTLIIRGNDENIFGENTPKLIEVLKSIPNLQQLDIRNSHGGIDSLKPIKELCGKNKVMKINFDGLFPNEFEQYSTACLDLVSLQAQNSNTLEEGNDQNETDKPSLLRISFPFDDMQHLVNTNVIKESDFRHFQDKFFYSPEAPRSKETDSKNKNLSYRQVKNSPLAGPSNLYTLNADEEFPRYIDEEVVEQFRKDIQTFSINGKPEIERDINDEAFRSMLLSSRTLSRNAQTECLSPQSTYLRYSNEISPQQSPHSVKQRNINESENGFEEEEEEENSSIGSIVDVDSNEENSDENNNSNEENSDKQTNSDDDNNNSLEISDEDNSEKQTNSDDNDNDSDDDQRERNLSENDDLPKFNITKLVDIKKYNYAEWKNLDNNYTLQNLYSRMTKSSSELNQSTRSSRTKSKK